MNTGLNRTDTRSRSTSNERGTTLVELMMSIIILGMVVAVAASVHAFGSRAFISGESQAWLQMNIDTAMCTITPKVRNATEIAIMTSKPGSYDTGYWYVYLANPQAQRTSITMRSTGGVEQAITDGIVPGATGLSFGARAVGGKVILTITIGGAQGSKTRQVATGILLGNITALPSMTSGSVLRFKTPN